MQSVFYGYVIPVTILFIFASMATINEKFDEQSSLLIEVISYQICNVQMINVMIDAVSIEYKKYATTVVIFLAECGAICFYVFLD